jgi:hypothetical protein
MRRIRTTLILIAVATFAVGCSDAPPEPPPEVAQPTPPEVEEAFQVLKAEFDGDRPGASVQRLRVFLDENRDYDIADRVQAEVDGFRLLAEGRYHDARELARQGRFARAEVMLEDLALHLADTADGEAAQGHLEFDFHFVRAQWFLIRQRYSESADVARPLLKRDLTPVQMDQVEALLDQVGNVGEALSLAERQAALSAVRQLSIALAQYYVEEGRYPSHLSLDDLDGLGGFGSRGIARGLSDIQEYRPTRDGYSFVAVSAKGQHRVRIVDGTIQD